jgi:predicted lipid-binding transport protein (Tim44 family)
LRLSKVNFYLKRDHPDLTKIFWGGQRRAADRNFKTAFETRDCFAYVNCNSLNGGSVTGVVLLAMVAAFLGFRLYSVLGRRTGHEQPLVTPAEERKAPLIPATTEPNALAPAATAPENIFEADASLGIRTISAADHRFDVGRFVEGAQSAYRMILEAYWSGDEAALAPLTSDDVRQAFADAIAARTTAGHVLDNRLVRIEHAIISHARVEAQTAHITVRFDADIAAVTRNGEGQVVAGSLSDAVPTHDVWTFSRAVRSAEPEWILTDTDEAA